MTQSEKECECKPDRIVTIARRAMDDLIFREDPLYYDGTGPGGEVKAALVISGVRRRMEGGVAISAVTFGCDRDLPNLWEQVQKMASDELAKHRSEGLPPSVHGLIS